MIEGIAQKKVDSIQALQRSEYKLIKRIKLLKAKDTLNFNFI